VTLRDKKVELSPQTFHPNADGQAGFADAIGAANPDLFQ
jgi:hypothetical protein